MYQNNAKNIQIFYNSHVIIYLRSMKISIINKFIAESKFRSVEF